MGQFLEYVKMALDNIRANKGRSFLTMLGIIMGITSVISIVSIGNGLKSDVMDTSSSQTNKIVLQTNSEVTTETQAITSDDINFLKNSLSDSVNSVFAAVNLSGKCTTRKGEFNAYITMTTPDYNNDQTLSPITKGSYFTETDLENQKPVCVIDELTALYLFGNTNVIGMSFELSIENGIQDITVVGIRQSSEDDINAEQSYQEIGMDKHIALEMPYTTSNLFGDPIEGFNEITLTAKDSDSASRIASVAVQVLNSRHSNLGENPFMKQQTIDLSNLFGTIMDSVTAFVALVASISLVVGGIGVMNIMLVSVTERTREIGIRKALGAKTGSIITQFLCESAIISGIGGIIGILMGGGITLLINATKIGGLRASLSLPAIIIATLFSCGVGIVFGIYPARKAANLKPIEALTHI